MLQTLRSLPPALYRRARPTSIFHGRIKSIGYSRRFQSSLPQRGPPYRNRGSYEQHQRPQIPRYVYYLIAVPVAGGIIWVANLEQVPYTGRRRAILVSSDLEKKLGTSNNQAILQQFSGRVLPPTHKTSQVVRRVGHRLVKASGLMDEHQWEFHVINDDDIMNAMAMPGGKVIVFTGLKKAVTTEEEMAAVLGHEIAHVLARHSAERMTLMSLLQLGLFTLAVLGFPVNDAWLALGRLVFELPFSRTHELEADAIGTVLCAKACYDPAAAIRVFERMEKVAGSDNEMLSFMSTHPSFKDRLQKLDKEVKEARIIYESNNCWIK